MSREIISVAQMRAIDADAARVGVPTLTLMENAGRAVAHALAARFEPQPVAVLCGPGNNGGDGWVAARVLQEAGWPVQLHSLVPREALHGDAALAAARWLGDIHLLTHLLTGETPDAALYIDALFGAGLTRPLEGVAKRLALSLPRERVIAVDVPSGIEGDSGRALGDIAFEAALTI
ncbi:MAG TPA: NAD(P)H-hydrate epimerase, partial [Verrucomicrobiae bacterium]|nr:NAD(P)H-hydrate epimerase [Verrucomicrobiae bacterium]